ncbi:MAG TPA: DUF6768 family protein [Phycisphaerae bacterium]|nr:DUF6768 family protein [Phycisphaerae bacterium]
MNDMEKDIKKALSQTEGPGLDPIREEGFREMIAATFRGRLRWMTIYAWVWAWVVTGVTVFAAIKMFMVDNTRELILYTALALVSASMVMFIKLWFWLLMNRNSTTREIKRLELRIAELAAKLGSK